MSEKKANLDMSSDDLSSNQPPWPEHASSKGFPEAKKHIARLRPWLIMLALYLLSSMPVVGRIINGGGEGESNESGGEGEHSNLNLSYEESEENDQPRGFFGDDGVVPQGLLPVHVMFGGVMNALGPLQLNQAIRKSWWSLHRKLGYVYITCGIGSGLTAICINIFNAHRYNTFNYVTNFFFGGWLAGSTLSAFVVIKRREIKRHQRWVIRSFGAALTVAVHRFYGGLLFITGTEDQLEITAFDGTLQDFLLSMITIVVAEVIARRASRSDQ